MEICFVGLGKYRIKKCDRIRCSVIAFKFDTCKSSIFILFHSKFEVNSTGFLVQNYENLSDTNIHAFFDGLKSQIKSVSIESRDVNEFLNGL